ncbi:MAG: hypothetical protein M0R46_08015 [Candidatus Muirbacterium halophilum]|nr:hypothetical protein [Candidatus Muirbacterium halophilum]
MKRIITILIVFAVVLSIYAKEDMYSSLVIDARDISLTRSMSPKILNESGLEVYGTVLNEKALEEALEKGVVAYIDTLENAKKHLKDRLGKNPLIIKAKGVVGKTASNLVLKNTDASKILKENKKSGFLDKFNVIILMSRED